MIPIRIDYLSLITLISTPLHIVVPSFDYHILYPLYGYYHTTFKPFTINLIHLQTDFQKTGKTITGIGILASTKNPFPRKLKSRKTKNLRCQCHCHQSMPNKKIKNRNNNKNRYIVLEDIVLVIIVIIRYRYIDIVLRYSF